MKQFVVMIMLTLFGIGGALLWTPAAGVCIYYFFAVLRPQYLWRFQMTGYPPLTWSFYVAAATIGSYLLWSIGLLSYGKADRSVMRYSPAFTAPHFAMLAFAAWITLSYIFSNDMNRSEEWYGEYLKIFVMYFIAARVLRTANQIWVLYLLFTIALAYIALDANQIYLSTGKAHLYRVGFARLDNNGVGLLLALGVPLCFFAWEMTRGPWRWLYLAGAVSIVHAVLTTYSRGAMIAMLAPLPWYAYFALRFAKRKWQIVLIALGVSIAIPVMAGKEITARFTSIERREVDHSFQSRELSWRIAIQIANDYPLFGAGIRCSALEMLKRGADMEGRTIHSQYLQIAADSGWIALLLYLILVGFTFASIWKARFRLWGRRDPDAIRGIAILNGVECSLVSFLVGALALSLEVFEPSYLLLLLGAQVWALLNATDTFRPGILHHSELPRPVQPTPPRRPQEPPPVRTTRIGPATGKHPFDRWQQPSRRLGQ